MPLFRSRYGKDYFESFLFREKINSRRNQNRLQEILPYHNNGRLLEIGCGTGGFIDLAARHFDVECMDVSAYAINRLAERFGQRAHQGNIEEVTMPFERYNVIAAYNVLEHLRQPGIVLKKIYHSLTPGGILTGSFPNNFGLIGGLHTALTNLFDQTHVATYPPKRWRRLFADADFHPIRFYGEVMLGHNNSVNVHHAAWPYLSFNLMFVAVKARQRSSEQ